MPICGHVTGFCVSSLLHNDWLKQVKAQPIFKEWRKKPSLWWSNDIPLQYIQGREELTGIFAVYHIMDQEQMSGIGYREKKQLFRRLLLKREREKWLKEFARNTVHLCVNDWNFDNVWETEEYKTGFWAEKFQISCSNGGLDIKGAWAMYSQLQERRERFWTRI